MTQLLKILHQEDRLSPSALAIVKGGNYNPLSNSCEKNSCQTNTGTCNINKCRGNSGDCDTNECKGNYIKNPNPNPSCNIEHHLQ